MSSKGIPRFTLQSAVFGIYYSEIFNTQVTQVHNTMPMTFIYIYLKSANFEASDFTFGKYR